MPSAKLPDPLPKHINDMLIVITSNMGLEAEKLGLSTMQVIRRMRISGVSLPNIEAFLLNDLQTGGQIFGEFRKSFKATMKYAVEETGRGAVRDFFPDQKLWDWLGVGDDKMCETCVTRHNDVSRTMDEWRAIGLPGAGSTICQENDRCTLVPAGAVDKTNVILRGKRKAA